MLDYRVVKVMVTQHHQLVRCLRQLLAQHMQAQVESDGRCGRFQCKASGDSGFASWAPRRQGRGGPNVHSKPERVLPHDLHVRPTAIYGRLATVPMDLHRVRGPCEPGAEGDGQASVRSATSSF